MLEKQDLADGPSQMPLSKDYSFGVVLILLKEGKKMARSGWNGKGMFIYYVPASRFKSLTEVAIKEFGEYVDYNEYIAIKNVNGTVSTWVPSINDCFANDWQIVD